MTKMKKGQMTRKMISNGAKMNKKTMTSKGNRTGLINSDSNSNKKILRQRILRRRNLPKRQRNDQVILY
jgi:hypothetical protein